MADELERALAANCLALLADIAAARTAGGWLYWQARYQALLAAIAEATTRYALTIEQRMVVEQRLTTMASSISM